MKKIKRYFLGVIFLFVAYFATAIFIPAPTHISNTGIKTLTYHEKLRTKSYKDSGGRWTIGYGHTGRSVHSGMRISKKTAVKLLRRDLAVAEGGVHRSLKIKTSQKQFDALVILAYNIGVGNFRKSSLLRYHNQGDFSKASLEFSQWSLVHKKISRGLMRRRLVEKALYDKGYFSIYTLYNYLFHLDWRERFLFFKQIIK